MEKENKLSDKSGIYCIINCGNNKMYIGQTINLKERYKKHQYLLDSNKHWNLDLQEDYNSNRFIFKVIKTYKITSLNRMEKFWIKKYNTYLGFGYNQSEGGDNFKIGKENPSYDPTIYTFEHSDGTLVRCTQYELKRKFKLSGHISEVCLGKMKSCSGWGLAGWTKRVKNKFKIYEFEHLDGTILKCTQSELRKKYDLKRNSISELCSGKKLSVYNWGLKGWLDKTNRYKIYKFKNINGCKFVGTKLQLKKKYNLNSGHLSAVCLEKRKSHKGWHIDK